MVGVGEVSGAVTVLAQARRFLRELAEGKLSAEHQALVSQALEVVADGQERIAQLQAEIIRLQQENQALRDQLRSADNWSERLAGFEQYETPTGGIVLREATTKRYACPRCAEASKQIHMLQYHGEYAGSYGCVACGKSYSVHDPAPMPDPDGSF
jgi:hypothetical protein